MFLASDCSSVASHGGVLMGVATARWGGGNSGGSTVGGGGTSTSKNRSSNHNYKSPKQFELKGSKST